MELIIGIVIGAAICAFLLGHHVGALSGYIKRAKEFEVSALAAINTNQTPKATGLLAKIESHLGKLAATPAPAAAPPAFVPNAGFVTGSTVQDGALRA
jgi:hypothetical protein